MGHWTDCKGRAQLNLRLGLFIFALALAQNGCFLPYALKQGSYQAKLLHGAKPIQDVMVDPKTSQNDKDKLLLITVLKRFAVNELAMPPSKAYATINPSWHYNLNTVSGSKALAFEPYLWHFPFVGSIPYLGFFDADDAKKEQEKLKRQDYDTMLVQVAAYSSLGYFKDPIWPQMLKRSTASLAELILHELAHGVLYFNGRSDFNESFANFVGKVGARQFLQRNFGAHSPELIDAIAEDEDEMRYTRWMAAIYEQLDAVYQSSLSDTQKREKKAAILSQAPASFKQISFRSRAFQNAKAPVINNANLLMSRRYNSAQEDFEALYEQVGGNFSDFYARLAPLRNEADPFAALKKMLK
jgi:predicted aminopeptidase